MSSESHSKKKKKKLSSGFIDGRLLMAGSNCQTEVNDYLVIIAFKVRKAFR